MHGYESKQAYHGNVGLERHATVQHHVLCQSSWRAACHVPDWPQEKSMLQLIPVSPKDVQDYRPIVGDHVIDEIEQLAAPFKGARVLHLNATGFGGGVAELLSTLVPLMQSVGIDAEWRIMASAPELWDATKAIHNLLQGAELRSDQSTESTPRSSPSTKRMTARSIVANWTPSMVQVWQRYNQLTAACFEGDYDFVVVHDPQPAGLLEYLSARVPASRNALWIWRCHIDLTRANHQIWEFMRPYLAPYDAAIFTMQEYVKPDIPIREIALIAPAIDPLSPKNVPLEPSTVFDIVRRFGVDPDRPLISQVSRFDPWKDPLGVIDVYRKVKRDVPGLQLAMVASMANDDPEGWHFFERTARHAGEDPDIFLLTNIKGIGNVEVNAFQRASSVVLQKSIREGFALTVSEALWKGRPVVATSVGGIPLQVASGQNGYLVSNKVQCAERTLQLLQDHTLADTFGASGRERVRQNFLMTRDLADYLQLFRRLRGYTSASANTLARSESPVAP
jgi:trehalose synthase